MFRSFNRTYGRGVCAIRGHRELGELSLCSREGASVLIVLFLFIYFFDGTRFCIGQGDVAAMSFITDSLRLGL